MRTAALISAGLALAIVIAGAGSWLALERGLLNGFIESRFAAATGLHLDLGQAPTLRWRDGRLVIGVRAVTLRGDAGERVASLSEAQAAIEPLAFTGGTIDIADAVIDGFTIDATALQERLVVEGSPDADASPAGWTFELRDARLTDGEIGYRADGIAETLVLSVESVDGQWGETTSLQVSGAGGLQSRAWQLDGSGPTLEDWRQASTMAKPVELGVQLAESTAHVSLGPAAEVITVNLDAEADLVGLLHELLPEMPALLPFQAEATLDRSGAPFGVEVSLEVNGTEASFEGALDRLAVDAGLAGKLRLRATDLTPLLAHFDLPAVSAPPAELSARLVWDSGQLQLDEISGSVGASDISGSLALDLEAERKAVTGDLRSERLVAGELLSIIGVAPDEAAEAAVEAGDPGVLPSARIDPSAWAGIDIDLHVRVAKLEMEQLPFDRALLHVVAEDGWLTVDPLDLGLGDGQILVFGSYDTTQTPPVGRLDARFRGIPIGTVLQRLGQEGEMVGAVDGRVQLEGRGYAVDEWLGSSNGRIVLLMADGRVDAVLLELLGLDVFESLLALVADDAESDAAVPIACLVLNMPVEAGIGRARPILLDSRDSKLTVDGTVGFADETLDLIIRLHPKDASLLSGNQPISAEGSWRSPEIAPAPGGVENPALGWLMAPLAAILPFVDLGLAEDAPCGQLIRAAEAESAAQ